MCSLTNKTGYTAPKSQTQYVFQPIHQSQDIEHGGHIRVIMPRGLLQVLQSLLAQGHGHLVPALRGILDDQVVQGSQTCWDLIASLLGCDHGCTVMLVLHCGGQRKRAKSKGQIGSSE